VEAVEEAAVEAVEEAAVEAVEELTVEQVGWCIEILCKCIVVGD